MTPERWRQVEELYHAARDLSGPDRGALLEGADTELRALVISLIARDDTAAGDGAAFLERPATRDYGRT